MKRTCNPLLMALRLPRLLLENQTAYLLWIFLSMLIYPVVMMR